MAQRFSEYDREKDDHYSTPSWVTRAVVPFLGLRRGAVVLEPAPGDGSMARALEAAGYAVIQGHRDFLQYGRDGYQIKGIVTNPPYGQGGRTAQRFIETALREIPPDGVVAMLLKVDFDSGITRSRLFDVHTFAAKVVLRNRVVWFEPQIASPSENHAWFIWHGTNIDAPTIHYATKASALGRVRRHSPREVPAKAASLITRQY
jgi:hypothetical protein